MFGGLAVNQALTLFTTPVVYLYLDRLSQWFGRRNAHDTAGPEGEPDAAAPLAVASARWRFDGPGTRRKTRPPFFAKGFAPTGVKGRGDEERSIHDAGVRR